MFWQVDFSQFVNEKRKTEFYLKSETLEFAVRFVLQIMK